MSIGFGGWCYISAQDENTVIYQYGSYNLNDELYRNKTHIMDGLLIIDKNSLVEPDIHKKLKRLPGGMKKLIIKQIFVDVSYSYLYNNGKIQIENCSNCWKTVYDNQDFIAWHLIWNLFTEYQKNGYLPEKTSFHV